MQTVEEIYQRYIKPLTNYEKLRLIAKIANEMADEEFQTLQQSNLKSHKSEAKPPSEK